MTAARPAASGRTNVRAVIFRLAERADLHPPGQRRHHLSRGMFLLQIGMKEAEQGTKATKLTRDHPTESFTALTPLTVRTFLQCYLDIYCLISEAITSAEMEFVKFNEYFER